MNALEAVVEFIRDSIVQPNVGRKWVNTWTPLILTFFVFILCANAIGLIPIFELWGVARSLRAAHGQRVVRARRSCTAARPRRRTSTSRRRSRRSPSCAIIVAGSKAHGFVTHWKNIVPHGLAWPLYILLIPIEVMGMFVKPFALTMRLAANMMGGHIAILAILSFVFLFTEMFGQRRPGSASAWPCRCRWPSAFLRLRSSSSWSRLTCSRSCRPCSSAWPFTFITEKLTLHGG